jgi:hypothetical protein
VSREVFDAVQTRLQNRKIKVERTAFTGKILCEVCDRNFHRATKQYKGNKRKVMSCANKKAGIPCECRSGEIPESILKTVTAEVLELDEFDADVFTAKIKQIVVPSRNVLVYHFTDGKTVTQEWKSTARTDCWTAARRAAQAERCRGKEATEETRQKRREATIKYYEQHPERRKADSERMKKFCSENPDWGKEQNERLTASRRKKKS